MKKLIFLGIIFLLSACSNDEELYITNEDSLFPVTSENALISCGGKSRILQNENEEIIKIEIKESDNGKYKFVEFSTVETDSKRGKFRTIIVYLKKNNRFNYKNNQNKLST